MPRRPTYDRDHLIDLASALFWKQGWAGTSLKDLEQVLGLKPGSIYAAFGSKADLFALALDRYADNNAKTLRQLVAAHGALGALQRYPGVVTDPARPGTKACLLAKTVLELRDDPAAERANAHLTAAENGFAALFRTAQQTGDIAPHHDPVLLARRYQSDLMGLRVFAERAGVDAMQIAQDIADGLAGLGAAPPQEN